MRTADYRLQERAGLQTEATGFHLSGSSPSQELAEVSPARREGAPSGSTSLPLGAPSHCSFCEAGTVVLYEIAGDVAHFCPRHAVEILGTTPAEMWKVLERGAA